MLQRALLWGTLFLICMGLGYPTLNRYNPRQTGGLSDTGEYYDLVKDGPAAVSTHGRYRVLVPFLARPIYRLAEGRIGSWEPVYFGLLFVNAFFTASTAYLLVALAPRLVGSQAVALLAAAVYLLNFEVANARLAAMVDSAEGFFLLALAGCLLSRRLYLLPLCGILGAMGKETFAPFSLVFTTVWWIMSRRDARYRAPETLLIFSTGLAALATVAAVQSVVSGRMVLPWDFAGSMLAASGHLEAVTWNLLDLNLLYGFIWLLPLGVWRLNRLPHPWLWASVATAAVGFLLVGYHLAAPGTAARFLFTIMGPLLSLSVACGAGLHPAAGFQPAPPDTTLD